MTDATEEAKVELNTTIAVAQWLREVYSTKLLSTSMKLKGPGAIVQIDESLMRHKPKVSNQYDALQGHGWSCAYFLHVMLFLSASSGACHQPRGLGIRHG